MVGPPVRSGWPNVDHVPVLLRRRSIMSVPSSQFSNTASLNVSIPEVGEPPVLSDDEILAKARGAANGAKFRAYFDNGEFTPGAHSRAVLGLCNYLAFWANCNIETIDRLFRRSALCTPGWDAPYRGGRYGLCVIAQAVSNCMNVYRPSASDLHRLKVEKLKASPTPVVDGDPEFDTTPAGRPAGRDDDDRVKADDLL